MNWWERITNRGMVAEKKEKGEVLNRKERRLIKEKEGYKSVGQCYASAVVNGRTLNPYAVQMAKDWRNKHGVNNKMSRNQRKIKNKV